MLLHALKKSFEADISEHSATIDIYLQNPVGIGDHDKLLEVVKDRFEKLTCAKHSLEELEKIISVKKETETENKAEAKTKTK